MNNEYYEKLLEDVEDYLIGAREDSDTVLFRVRDMLKQMVGSAKAHNFDPGDIVTDGVRTLIVLRRDSDHHLVIAYSALQNNVLLITSTDLVHFHKVGHMEPIKITIHNEEEN